MSKTIENLLMYNIIGFGVFVVGTVIGLIWFRAMGDPLERDTILFIVKMFLAIWLLGNLLFFVIR